MQAPEHKLFTFPIICDILTLTKRKEQVTVLDPTQRFENKNLKNVIIDRPTTGGTPPKVDSGSPYDPDRTPSGPEKKGSKRGIIAIGAGALAAATLTATLFGLAPKGDRGPAVEETPQATPTSQEVDPTAVPNNGGELPFGSEILVPDMTIEQMDNIKDLSEFAALSYADHLAYALDKNPQLSVSTPDNDFGFSTPSSIPPYFWNSITGTALAEGDALTGQKIDAALYYYDIDPVTNEISSSYQALADSTAANGGEGVMNTTSLTFDTSGAPQSGVDAYNNPIDFINVTYHTADSASGEATGSMRTSQAIRTRVQLADGSIIISYPIGYGTEGQAAPEPNGTY